MRNGHFHVALSNEVCINESSLAVAVAKARARVDASQDDVEIVTVGYVSTYGDGLIHPLHPSDRATVTGSFPDFTAFADSPEPQ